MLCEVPIDLYIWGYFSMGLFLFWIFHVVLSSIFTIMKYSYEAISYSIEEYRQELSHDLRF